MGNKDVPSPTADFIKNLKESSQESSANETASKILFTGLDNSGKTSIILALQREISQIAMLKPTRQAQRKIFDYLGKQIAEWDLGGQKRYRISYLKEPGRYFDNTSVCIYVIDVQDSKRLGEALSYFSDVIKQFKELELSEVKIHIFFHKMDPDFVKEQSKIRLDGMIKDLEEKIEKIIKDEFDTTFHKTTIYELWSIVSSFSTILLELYPQSALLDKTMNDFAGKLTPCDGILILDSNSLIIGQYFKNPSAKEILSNSTPYFLTLNDSLSDIGEGSQMIVQRRKRVFYFDQFFIPKSEKPLYLLIMSPKDNFPKEQIQSFINVLKGII